MKYFLALIFSLNCTGAFSLSPAKIYSVRPETLSLPYRQLFIVTPDNARLNAWIFSAKSDTLKKNITILIAEQDAGNMSSQLLLADALIKNGFDVMTFDYRGFGESSNFKIDSSYLYYSEFVTDLVSAMRMAKTLFPNNKTCILARSMGSIITAIACKEEQVDYVIGDGFIKSLQDAKRRISDYKKITIQLPADSMRYTNAISGISAKMLLFAGTYDWLTTAEEAKKIVEKNYNRKLVTYAGGHLETAKVMTQETYADAMIREMISFFHYFKN